MIIRIPHATIVLHCVVKCKIIMHPFKWSSYINMYECGNFSSLRLYKEIILQNDNQTIHE